MRLKELKVIEQAVLGKMIETLEHFLTAGDNSWGDMTQQRIEGNMANYFCGLADALEAVTGYEYNFSSTDKINYRIVRTERGKTEHVLYTTIRKEAKP